MSLKNFRLPLHLFAATSLFLSMAPSSPLIADEAEARAIILQAYRQADTADSVEQFTSLLALCDEALQKEPTTEQIEYLGNLKAWLFNKRGEARAHDATAAIENGADAERLAQMESEALADFEQAIELDASLWRAVHNRGISLALLGQTDAAIADFEQTITLNPQYGNAHFNLGEIYYHQGENEKAIAAYTEAIRLDTRDIPSRSARGHAYLRQGRTEEALADYAAVIQLSPQDPIARVSRADAYVQLRRWNNAVADLQAAIAIDKEFSWAYCRLAWVLATCPDETLRNAERAMTAAGQAMELHPEEDYRYFDTLAAAEANNGDFDAAGVSIARALELAPEEQKAMLQERQQLYSQDTPFTDR